MTTPNPHLATPVERWGPAPAGARLTVLALHGRGHDPASMRAVAERVGLGDVAWVAPAADGGTWYPESFLAPVADNEPRLSWALAAVDAHRAALAAEGVGAGRLVLLGFSQGAVLLAEHLVRTGDACAGAVLLTGGFVGPPGSTPEAAPLGPVPVLLCTSSQDVLVPVQRVRDTAALLEAAGADVVLEVEDDPEHHVSDAAVASARRLIARVGS